MGTQTISNLGPAEIGAISAAVAAVIQVLKMIIPAKFAPIACLLMSAIGVGAYAGQQGYAFGWNHLFDYFVAWGTVSCSATGIFSLTRTTGEGIKNALGPKLDE